MLDAEPLADGVEVLFDERDERPGVKFKDADLIGVPLRVTVSSRGLNEGVVELKWRTEKQFTKVPVAEAEARLAEAVQRASAPRA